MRDPEIHGHQNSAHQQSGQDPGQKQCTDRGVRDERIKHHRDRRRNNWSDCRRGGGDRCGIAGGEAPILAHHVDDDLADTRGISDGRAGHARKYQRCHDVDVPKPAFEPADGCNAEIEQAVRDGARIHDICRNDEKRNGEQKEALIDAVCQCLTDDPDRGACCQHIGHGRNDDRIGDRHSDSGQEEERSHHDHKFEAHFFCSIWVDSSWCRMCTSWSAPWRMHAHARHR